MVTVNNSCQTSISNSFFKRFFNFSSTKMIYKYMKPNISSRLYKSQTKILILSLNLKILMSFEFPLPETTCWLKLARLFWRKGLSYDPTAFFVFLNKLTLDELGFLKYKFEINDKAHIVKGNFGQPMKRQACLRVLCYTQS